MQKLTAPLRDPCLFRSEFSDAEREREPKTDQKIKDPSARGLMAIKTSNNTCDCKEHP